MYRSILVPLDGTEFGDRVLPLATAIARKAGAAVELTHVHEPRESEAELDYLPQYRFQNVVAAEHVLDNARCAEEETQLKALASTLSKETGAPVSTKVIVGEVTGSLCRHTEKDPVDLVVMATHARSGMKRLREGSVAGQILRHCHAPMLLLPPAAALPAEKPLEVTHILVALDGTPGSEQVLPHAVEFARLTGARLTLLRVVDYPAPRRSEGESVAPPELTPEEGGYAYTYLEALAAKLERRGFQVATTMVTSTDPGRAILECAKRYDADLIAMATHARGDIGRMIMGGVTESVLHDAAVPMLVFRMQAAAVPAGV